MGRALATPVVTIQRWLQRRTAVNKVFVVLCCFASLAIRAGAQNVTSGHSGDGAAGVAARLQRIEDLEAVRAIPACYGYGHDLIFRHLGGDHKEAIDALLRCHVNALTTRVFLFDETTATATLHSIRELIAFVESFARDQGYSSARNVPGNVQVAFTGPTTARVQSSTVAPHFLTLGPKSPATDFVAARYVSNVVRGDDGIWRVVEFDLIVQQIWRGVGAYPFAQP
jgi:SnoaL-like protein